MKKALVVGIGGAGTNTVARLSSKKYNLYAINSEDSVLKLGDIKATQTPLSALKELDLNEGLEKKVLQNFKSISDKSKEVFLIAGFGSNYSFEIVNYIKNHIDKPKHLICFFPFNLERARRIKAAIDLTELIEDFDSILIYDNNYLVKKCPSKSMKDAFKIADKQIEKHIKIMCG